MKWTPQKIKALKGKQKITALTAHDCYTAKLIDEADIPLILVGDSLGMTVLGYENTLPVTLEEMLHHTKAVTRATKSALVIGDMPFLTYQTGTFTAIANAGRFIKEAGADAVKIEGGAERAELVAALVLNGIPVVGHIGLTPQSIKAMGGYKVQGKTSPEMARLIKDARALEEAGAFAIVLEALPAELAKDITAAVSIPTIGIGAGEHCDGQILVIHDVLGLFEDFTPKFAKQYAQLGQAMRAAIGDYKSDVEGGSFPTDEHSY